MFQNSQSGELKNVCLIPERLVNLPSSITKKLAKALINVFCIKWMKQT